MYLIVPKQCMYRLPLSLPDSTLKLVCVVCAFRGRGDEQVYVAAAQKGSHGSTISKDGPGPFLGKAKKNKVRGRHTAWMECCDVSFLFLPTFFFLFLWRQ